jgi:hypothetical protein
VFVLQVFDRKHAPPPAWRCALSIAVVVVVLLAEATVVLPHPRLLVLLVVGIWMAAPGVAVARALFRSADERWVTAWLVGPAIGLGLSVAGMFVWWAGGVQGWLAIVAGPLWTWVLAWWIGRVGPPALRLPEFGARDVSAAALLVLIVPVITWAPYDHVREPVADGEAYRAYFTADFVWAMTVTGELAKGDVPPANPFLRDRPLNYYWFAHFLSGVVYRNAGGGGLSAEPVILINGLMFAVAFVLFAYALVRTVGASPWVSAFVVACGFCANSYEGADMIRSALTGRMPWSELANTNVDAVTRWFYKGMAVDGLQRLLLYQPHHLTGYALALAALWLVALADDVTALGIALGAGCLLGLALLFSTFSALMVAIAVGLLYGLRLVQQRAIARAWQCAALGGGPVLLGVLATSMLGYTDTRYGSLLLVGLNPVAAHNVVRIWILSFGPLLLGAAASLAAPRWVLREGAAPAALVIAATTFWFFTNVPDSGDVWVGWRSGHMLLIAFAAMSGAWLTRVWQVRRWRAALIAAVMFFVMPAVPTVAIDVYNAQDITNRSQGADFPWTLVITPAEREALDWVRHSTPPRAVVQIDPEARGAAQWSYIGAFAERRMIAGLPGSMTPFRPYQEASDAVEWDVFRTTQAADSHASARRLGIDYLFIGRPERHWHREVIQTLRRDPTLFPVAFENEAVTILRVAPSGSRRQAPGSRLQAPGFGLQAPGPSRR